MLDILRVASAWAGLLVSADMIVYPQLGPDQHYTYSLEDFTVPFIHAMATLRAAI